MSTARLTMSILSRVQRAVQFGWMRLRQKYAALRRKRLQKKVSAQKEQYKRVSKHYLAHPEVTFVIQSFNKSHVVSLILDRLLSYRSRHIILIDDGSVDDTYQVAAATLVGQNHYILRTNDLHEVTTYDLALRLVETDFVCLMQDDDVPPVDDKWISESLELFRRDEDLVVVGLRNGVNFNHIDDGEMRVDSMFHSVDREIWVDGVYEAQIVQPDMVTLNGKGVQYCQVVNRAPTFIRFHEFIKSGGIDRSFTPFQNDDIDYCLRLWQKGKRVMVVTGYPFQRNVGIGGMRLFNNVRADSRPRHMCENWNRVADRYRTFVNSGEAAGLVEIANEQWQNRLEDNEPTL